MIFPILKGIAEADGYICFSRINQDLIQQYMCDTQTLAYANDGYIIRCPQCNRIQLAFGTVVVVTKEKQLKKLKERAELELLCRSATLYEPDLKSVTLPITQTTMLCLSMKELEAFTELLAQAFALLEVYALLDSVNG